MPFYPTFITNATPLPVPFLVPGKKALYTFGAGVYLKLLHNAAFKWSRGATDVIPDWKTGQVITAEEIVILTDAFPTQWASYPPTVPAAPDDATVRAYKETQWQPRQNEALKRRSRNRNAADFFDLTWVDYATLADDD